MRYYSLDPILKRSCLYNFIIGERSNGKTTACLRYAIQQFLKNGSQTAIIRRYREDFRSKRGLVLFDTLCHNGLGVNEIREMTKGKYDGVYYYAGRWFLSKYDAELDKQVPAPEPFCVAFSLTESEHEKSTSWPYIRVVIFDEVLARNYLPNEFLLFTSLLSTIIRAKSPDEVKIFMLGNTVNKFCPYFSEMGLRNVAKMKQGTIDVYKYEGSELTVAVEYCESSQKYGGKKSDVFFAFEGNPQIKMITTGCWEVPMYPHNTEDFDRKDIKFIYFIIWEDNMLQCEVVSKKNSVFTFIHRKTTDIKNEDKDIIFAKDYHQQMNYFRNIARPTSRMGKRLWWFYQSDNVYYQDNEVGEIVSNYLKWCKSEAVAIL